MTKAVRVHKVGGPEALVYGILKLRAMVMEIKRRRRVHLGTSLTFLFENTTTTSSQPPLISAVTALCNHLPSAASTFGMPKRVPAPAASTMPATAPTFDMRTLSTWSILDGCPPRS